MTKFFATKFFATTTRGLESISADEIAALPGTQVNHVAYRRITASLSGDLAPLLALRTVDDVFLHLATWHDILPQRAALARFKELAPRLDMRAVLEAIRKLRPVSATPTFSVTASFVGKRNYSSDEIKEAVAQGLVTRYAWKYGDEDQSQINLRLFIEHEIAYVGVRLSEHSLHSRPYKQSNIAGSLKPPVAAAMIRLADVSSRSHILDPFCGAGTIPIEAALAGFRTMGGDYDPPALQSARSNAALAARDLLPFVQWDATHLPIASRSIPCIISNLPWGRQVIVDAALSAFYRQTCLEIERVLAPGGVVVLLTSLPQLLNFDTLTKQNQIEISLFGQNPSIALFTRALQ